MEIVLSTTAEGDTIFAVMVAMSVVVKLVEIAAPAVEGAFKFPDPYMVSHMVMGMFHLMALASAAIVVIAMVAYARTTVLRHTAPATVILALTWAGCALGANNLGEIHAGAAHAIIVKTVTIRAKIIIIAEHIFSTFPAL